MTSPTPTSGRRSCSRLVGARGPERRRGRRGDARRDGRRRTAGSDRRLPHGATHEGRDRRRGRGPRPHDARVREPRAPARARRSTSWARAATAAARSTSPPSPRSSSPAPVCPWPSTATAPPRSHCGSADVLEALGVKIDLDAAGVERCLAEAGIGFLFAPRFHPPMAPRGAGARANSASPPSSTSSGRSRTRRDRSRQAVGCSDARMLPLMAEVLARRGTAREALPRRGRPGRAHHHRRLDRLRRARRRRARDAPRSGGPGTRARHGGRPAGRRRRRVRRDRPRASSPGERGPQRDVVLLNAGAALEVAGVAASLAEGMAAAAASIDYGAAAAMLERWVGLERPARMAERVASRAMILSDRTIREEIDAGRIVIDPFDPAVRPAVLGRPPRRLAVPRVRELALSLHRREAGDARPHRARRGEAATSRSSCTRASSCWAPPLERVAVPNDLVARLEGKSSLGPAGPADPLHRRLRGSRLGRLPHAGAVERGEPSHHPVSGDEDRADQLLPPHHRRPRRRTGPPATSTRASAAPPPAGSSRTSPATERFARQQSGAQLCEIDPA